MPYLKTIKWFIYSLLLTLVTALACTLIFLSSNAGTAYLIQLAQKNVPGLSIGNVRGALLANVEINNITYEDDTGTKASIGRVAFSWHPAYLLRLQFFVENITLADADIDIVVPDKPKQKQPKTQPTENNTTASNSSSFNPLKHIAINSIDIKNIKLAVNDDKYAINEFTLTPADDNDLHQINLDSSLGDINGHIKFTWSPYPSWDIALQGKQAPEGTSPTNISIALKTDGYWSSNVSERIFDLTLEKLTGKVLKQKLTGKANIHYKNNQLTIAPSTIQLGSASLTANGTLTDMWNVDWQVTIPKLQTFTHAAKGRIIINGTVRGKNGDPEMSVKMSANQLHFDDARIHAFKANLTATPARNATATLKMAADKFIFDTIKLTDLKSTLTTQLQNNALQASLEATVNKVNTLTASIALPNFKSDNALSKQKIQGSGKIRFIELDKLFARLPDKATLQGVLTSDLDLSGTLNKPKLTAKLTVSDGQVDLPKLGLNLNAIGIQATYQTNKDMQLHGQLTSGQGTATFKGTLDEENLIAKLTVNGNNVQVINSNEYKATLTPNIQIHYSPEKLTVKGDLNIPFADITPADFSSVVSLPDETTFVGEEPADEGIFMKTVLDLNVKFENPAHLAYHKFNTGLGGQLRIQKDVGGPITAVGELNTIDGKYRAYGKPLIINQGKLLYTGNTIANPGLSIKATTTIRKVGFASDNSQFSHEDSLGSAYSGSSELVVGISLTGTLDQPKLTFFSTPSGISQKDIISYLVFGKPQSQVGALNSLALINDIASDSNSGSGGITDIPGQLQESLGLSDLEIGSTDYYDPTTQETGSTTTVSVGKDLGNNLSIHYSAGLTPAANVLNIRYKINRHLNLQAETSGLESGADIVYVLERN